jgi:hypothetical protein
MRLRNVVMVIRPSCKGFEPRMRQVMGTQLTFRFGLGGQESNHDACIQPGCTFLPILTRYHSLSPPDDALIGLQIDVIQTQGLYVSRAQFLPTIACIYPVSSDSTHLGQFGVRVIHQIWASLLGASHES